MSTGTVAFLSLIIVGFVAFAVTLAFGHIFTLTDPANGKRKE